MKELWKLLLSLGLVCAVGSTALVLVRNKTLAPIAKAERAALMANLKLVLPAETARVEAMDGADFYRALDGQSKVIGYAGTGIGPKGFGGPVKVLVGFDAEGQILGVMVTEHSETPGLGTKATERKTMKSIWHLRGGAKKEKKGLPPNEYLDQYTGRLACAFKASRKTGGNRVRVISGATYSSKAIVEGVNAACARFQQLTGKGALQEPEQTEK